MKEDAQYHANVMALVSKINDTINADTGEFSIRVNALLTLIALAGAQSTLSKDEFFTAVTWQLGEIMSRMVVSESTIQ
jgi:hypothetical protein